MCPVQLYYVLQALKLYWDISKSKLFNGHYPPGSVKSPRSPNCADCSKLQPLSHLHLKHVPRVTYLKKPVSLATVHHRHGQVCTQQETTVTYVTHSLSHSSPDEQQYLQREINIINIVNIFVFIFSR